MKENTSIREIQKDYFISFKKVRDLESHLYGHYQLYSKNGMKYIGKYLPKDTTFVSYRNPAYPILKFGNKDLTMFLFPIHGQPIANFVAKAAKDMPQGEIKQWVDKKWSVQNCLWDIARLLIRLVEEKGLKEILSDCLRVHNGELQYCYDSWMQPAHSIVLLNPNELESHFFSEQELENIRNLANEPLNNRTIASDGPSKRSLYFKVFMLILQLGTPQLNHRNYEYNLYKLNRQHISMRLHYFCSKFNHRGLGDLTSKVIEETAYSMEEIWRITMPQLEQRRSTKSKSGISSYRTIKSVKSFKKNKENQQQPFHFDKINTSFVSDISAKELQEESRFSLQKKVLNLKQSNLKTRKNEENSLPKKSRKSQQSNGKCKTQHSRIPKETVKNTEKDKQKTYHLFPQNDEINLRQLLLQSLPIPSNCLKIMKYFNLEQHIPVNHYEEHILSLLDNVHIKPNWIKQIYQNGSIYLGEAQNGKKEGKGLYLFGSNDFYYGDWNSNFMSGYGNYVFANGEIYEGQISKGFKEGHGKCFYEDGREYEGSWSNNCKIGLGKVKFPNGVTFIGIFKPNCNQTEGIFIGPFGQSNVPLWENKGILQNYNWQQNTIIDNRSAEQTLFDKRKKLKACLSEFYSERRQRDGGSYQGELVDGKKHGFGIYQNETERYQGQWFQDKREGHGILHVKDGFSIAGRWKDNVMVEYAVQDEQLP